VIVAEVGAVATLDGGLVCEVVDVVINVVVDVIVFVVVDLIIEYCN